jgi:hypothetical protein
LVLNISYPSKIDLLDMETPTSPEVTNRLSNNNQIIYIRTTKEQDAAMFKKAQQLSTNPDSYSLCTKNCLDSVQDIMRAGGVNYPVDLNPKPKIYFKKLKLYYPDNATNKAYEQN